MFICNNLQNSLFNRRVLCGDYGKIAAINTYIRRIKCGD